MVYTIFDQKTSGGSIKNENMSNQHIAEELYKSVIRKFKKKKITFYRKYMGCWSCWYAINK